MLSLVYAIPTSAMGKQLNESKTIMEKESFYPSLYARQGIKASYDNFTVYYMLNLAAQSGPNPFVEALKSNQYFLEQNPSEALEKAIAGESNGSYMRYWHGYLVFLKPLLLVFNIVQIRLLCQTLFFVLLVLVVGRLACRGDPGIGVGVILALSYCLFGAAQATETLPVFSSFALSLIGCLWMLYLSKKKIGERKKGVFTEGFILFCSFSVLGALAVYLDFLDNPILTLCVPAALYFYLERRCLTLRKMLTILAAALIGWVIGYIGLWLGKWVLAEIITGTPVISVALDRVMLRSGMSEPEVSGAQGGLKAILVNLSSLGFMKYIHLLTGLCALICAVICIAKALRSKESIDCSLAITCIGLLLVSLLPYLWYIAASNHSIVHATLLTFRTQIAAFFSWAMIVFLVIRENVVNRYSCNWFFRKGKAQHKV